VGDIIKEKIEETTQLKIEEMQSHRVGTSGYVACCMMTYEGKTNPLVIFQGTMTFNQWMVDFSILTASSKFSPDSPKVTVHEGFFRSYTNMYTKNKTMQMFIKEYLNTFSSPGKQVFVCGHSLGGALATLCAYDLTVNGYKAVGFTYGAPRVGMETFYNAYKQYNIKLFQYQNVSTDTWNRTIGIGGYQGDPVPTTPFQMQGYVHVGCILQIKSGTLWSQCKKVHEKPTSMIKSAVSAALSAPGAKFLSLPKTAFYHTIPKYINILSGLSGSCSC
jgi:predicted lipase